jgi:DHA1 family tetracycline resistance protein-like MFS transporter
VEEAPLTGHTATRKPDPRLVAPSVLLDGLGFGLLFPIIPDLFRRLNAAPLDVDRYTGYFLAVYCVMQFIAAPVLGSLSDRFGRRSILLLSALGETIDYTVMALAQTVWLLFLGRVISGATEAIMAVANSYAVDACDDDDSRSAAFGFNNAALGIGFILGPALGGLLGHFNPRLPLWASAVSQLANLIFVWFFLPESLPPEKRRSLHWKQLNPFVSLGRLTRYSAVFSLVVVFFLLTLAEQSNTILTLFTQYRFHFTTLDVGLLLSFFGVSIAVSQGLLTGVVVARLGEAKTTRLGIGLYVVAFCGMAFVPSSWMFYLATVPLCLGGLGVTALRSVISKSVAPEAQGELQGSIASVMAVDNIVAPLLYTTLFARLTTVAEGQTALPGIAYLVAAAISAVTLAYMLLRSEPAPVEL